MTRAVPRTVRDVIERIDEIHAWDASGESECELTRWVPMGEVPSFGTYRRDRGNTGDARPESAGSRAGYLLQRTQDVLDGPYSPQSRLEIVVLLRRAEEALWVAGADLDQLQEAREKHQESPTLLLRALTLVQRSVVPR